VSVGRPEADVLARMEQEASDLRRQIADFQAKLAAAQAKLATVEAAAQAFQDYLKVAAPHEPPAPPVAPAPEMPGGAADAAPNALTPGHPLYGKSLAEAGAVLIEAAGRPMTEEEIVAGMRDAGIPETSRNPTVNFRMSARRRPDILVYGDGMWRLAASEGAEPRSVASGCIPNRSREFHMAQSLAGLAAARARGVKGGRKPTIPPDAGENLRRLIAPKEAGGEGLSPRQAAFRLNISPSTAYRILERDPDAAPPPDAGLFERNDQQGN
jgi:hypothetical protein